MCLATVRAVRYEDRGSFFEGCEPSSLWEDPDRHAQSTQRILRGVVGQTLPTEKDGTQANGVGLGNR